MGNNTAKYLGLEKAPITKEHSSEKIISLVSTYILLYQFSEIYDITQHLTGPD
ncbi:uncharacterized protein GGS25DRAFT_488215 [Hypoxylon fragiforme]|uniref:uncharacterized protein n=1 Tax=Hypoxylon fragiforme TaxID=63214 RepID=UPI0020C5F78D|nr:uncharacterized protein GGS25DRAFT_488215 [Hypoxylon fragiforme]KAI2610271.1 hypothetical protein GGS25DRAFT_488215 [Hypoxylon fragiforme]